MLKEAKRVAPSAKRKAFGRINRRLTQMVADIRRQELGHFTAETQSTLREDLLLPNRETTIGQN